MGGGMDGPSTWFVDYLHHLCWLALYPASSCILSHFNLQHAPLIVPSIQHYLPSYLPPSPTFSCSQTHLTSLIAFCSPSSPLGPLSQHSAFILAMHSFSSLSWCVLSCPMPLTTFSWFQSPSTSLNPPYSPLWLSGLVLNIAHLSHWCAHFWHL